MCITVDKLIDILSLFKEKDMPVLLDISTIHSETFKCEHNLTSITISENREGKFLLKMGFEANNTCECNNRMKNMKIER